MYVTWHVEVPYRAKVGLLGFCLQRVDCVVVKGDLFHAELHLARFDLNACFCSSNDEDAEKNNELVKVIGS